VVAGFHAEHAPELRAQVDAARFTVFDQPDRGRYEVNRDLAIPGLFDELRAIGEHVTGRSLRCADARWIRMRHRDYQLIKDDAEDRPIRAAHVEITFDLSLQITGAAEIVYTDGHESWVVPQVPSAVSVVAREPWLFRYQRYLNVELANAVVHRLRLSLSYVDEGASR
jgi:hypothetical protein